jgi:hypothetical protein
MRLNPDLFETFKEYNINPSYGFLSLLAVYHSIPLTGDLGKMLDSTMMQINIAKIIDKDYKTNTLIWNTTLYEGEEHEWSWIDTEYRVLFKAANKLKAGSSSSCVRKMKEFFKKHPAVRKQDVIEATKFYISTMNDMEYLQQADYFITKNSDTKSSYTSRLEQFLELVNDRRIPSERKNYRKME